MALTCAQIVDLASQMAKTPGMHVQAGKLFNAILQDLAQDYRFEASQGFFTITFNPGLVSPAPSVAGCGPYPLPADFLRMEYGDFWWELLGVPYFPVAIDLQQFDAQVQMAGLNSYPYFYATDLSTSPPGLYIYPPPSGAFPAYGRYAKQQPDVVTPETDTTVPWFPNTNYLITRLAGEMMKISGDSRMQVFLGDGPEGAGGMLSKFMKMEGDKGTRAQVIKLDQRRFGRNFSRLPNTKTVGWT